MRKNNIRKILPLMIEICIFIGIIIRISYRYPERISSSKFTYVACIALTIGIILSKCLEIVGYKLYEHNNSETGRHRKLLIQTVVFSLIVIIFFLAYTAVGYYGEAVASFKTLMLISVLTTACHLAFGFM